MKKGTKCQSLPKNNKILTAKSKGTNVQSNKPSSKYQAIPQKTIQSQEKVNKPKKVNVISCRVNEAVQRKRCKSSFTHIEKDVQFVKNKMQQLTNQKHYNHFLLLYQQRKNQDLKIEVTQLKNEILRLKEHFICFQLLALKCQKILQASLTTTSNHQFYTIEKQQANSLIQILRQTGSYMHNQANGNNPLSLMHRLKDEAQSAIIYLNEQHKKPLGLLHKKEQALQYLQQECDNIKKADGCYQEIKIIVNQLIEEVTTLWEEISNKDSIIDSIMVQNNNLREDLKGMQELVKNTKEYLSNLAEELHITTEKVRMLELSNENKEEQIMYLQIEADIKNKELIGKLQQAEVKQVQLRMIRKEYSLALDRQREYRQRIAQYEQSIELLQKKNFQFQGRFKDVDNKQSTGPNSEYHKLQQQSNQLKKHILSNFKKIQLYQQKLIQLIALADQSHLLIQDQQGPIAHLMQQLQQDKKQSSYKTILEDNPQNIQRPSSTDLSDMFETKQGKYCFQGQQAYIKEQDEPEPHQQIIQQDHPQDKGTSFPPNPKHYQIHVIDEKQQTIDSYQI